jgi:hypothetical protein
VLPNAADLTISDAENHDGEDQEAASQTFEVGGGEYHGVVVHFVTMRQNQYAADPVEQDQTDRLKILAHPIDASLFYLCRQLFFNLMWIVELIFRLTIPKQ